VRDKTRIKFKITLPTFENFQVVCECNIQNCTLNPVLSTIDSKVLITINEKVVGTTRREIHRTLDNDVTLLIQINILC
jgi:hypothetical protein